MLKTVKRRLIAALFAFSLSALMLAACGGEVSEKITPQMWSVSADNGARVYMLGSAHYTPESMGEFPEYVVSAYEDSEYLMIEALPELSEGVVEAFLPEDESLSDILGDELFAEAVEFVGGYSRVGAEQLERYTPLGLYTLINMIVSSAAGLGSDSVDSYFYQKAITDGKQLLSAESREEIAEYMAKYEALMPEIVGSTLSGIGEGGVEAMASAVTEQSEAWMRGEEIISGAELAASEGLEAKMTQILITDRNENMARSILEQLEAGNKTFVVVGSAHFYGDDSILEQLEKKGYIISQFVNNH